MTEAAALSHLLLFARSLTDYHEGSMAPASGDDDVGSAGSEPAVVAGAAFSLEFFPFCVKSVCHMISVPSRVIRELYDML